MDKIKVGVIGAGFIGQAQIEALRRLGFVEVIALAESNKEVARQRAQKLYIDKYYDDYMELIENEDIQVIHNCTPNNMHFAINRAAIQAGKHIFSEKPLATKFEEAFALYELTKEYCVANAVNFNYRQYPLVKEMRERVSKGDIGDVYLVHGHYLQDWLLYDTDYDWRIQKDYGGSSRAIADIGSHWCDTVETIIGSRITRVFADLATIIEYRKKPDGTGGTLINYRVDTEDYGAVMVRFANGARGVFYVSQVSAGRKNRLSFEIDGSKASMCWDQENPNVLWIGHRDAPNEMLMRDPKLMSDKARSIVKLPGGHGDGWHDALANNIEQFYKIIIEGRKMEKDVHEFATFEQGAHIMAVVDAILRSANSGSWEDVKF
ncbi:Gfo/Idh/MocA family protein [Caldanaerobius polysaccharolyticus]|uniref:Gfo/Idh/MocA family protein n=1 Tax=Caldanaerobius polysaccharolyticus TaxID=44256 RepID=UPI0004796FDD|nr:Gfo/Idh/MocA family oxidoreductase [Caldanaerobius polysaccharolyticus]